jgi:hypothetical protein
MNFTTPPVFEYPIIVSNTYKNNCNDSVVLYAGFRYAYTYGFPYYYFTPNTTTIWSTGDTTVLLAYAPPGTYTCLITDSCHSALMTFIVPPMSITPPFTVTHSGPNYYYPPCDSFTCDGLVIVQVIPTVATTNYYHLKV